MTKMLLVHKHFFSVKIGPYRYIFVARISYLVRRSMSGKTSFLMILMILIGKFGIAAKNGKPIA